MRSTPLGVRIDEYNGVNSKFIFREKKVRVNKRDTSYQGKSDGSHSAIKYISLKRFFVAKVFR